MSLALQLRLAVLCTVFAVLASTTTLGAIATIIAMPALNRSPAAIADIYRKELSRSTGYRFAATARYRLSVLGSNPRVISAAVLDPGGRALASYKRRPGAIWDRVLVATASLTLPVINHGRLAGSLVIAVRATPAWALAMGLGVVYFAIVLLGCSCSILIYRWLVEPSVREVAFTVKALDTLTSVNPEAHSVSGSRIGLLAAVDRLRDRIVGDEQQSASRITELESESTRKTDILARASHELRNPLGALMGLVESLQDSRLSEPQRVLLDAIRGSGLEAVQLLGDLSDLAFLDAGRSDLEYQAIDIVELVRGLVSEVSVGSDAARFSAELADDAMGLWYADRLRLSQVLRNLIENARRHASEAQVWVALTAVKGGLQVSVADDGPGIPDDELARIFEPWTRGTNSSPYERGSGLGLAIARQLADLMGGTLTASHTPGGGACFVLDLPLQRAESADRRARQRLQTLRNLLIVDDLPRYRLAVANLLAPFSVDVREAENGEAALALLRARRFDVVLMDLRMPGLSGVEAVERFRAFDKDRQRTPVLAVTGASDAELQEAMARQLFDGVLRKPFNRDELARSLTSVGFILSELADD